MSVQGIAHSFNSLFNACHGDEIKFAELIIQRMMFQVPSWSSSPSAMATDLKRIISSLQVDQSKQSKHNDHLIIEEKVESWEISFSDLKLHKKIAEGFFGEVYKGELWGKTVAVKRLKLNYQSNEDSDKIVYKLKQEAAVMSSLRHPNVLLFMGLSSTKPNVCLVTEFIVSLWWIFSLFPPSQSEKSWIMDVY